MATLTGPLGCPCLGTTARAQSSWRMRAWVASRRASAAHLRSERGSWRCFSQSEQRITSPANEAIKRFVRLRNSAPFRDAEGSIIVPGVVPLREIVHSCGLARLPVRQVLCCDGFQAQPGTPESALLSAAQRVVWCPPAVLSKAAGVVNAESLGIAAEIAQPPPAPLADPSFRPLRVLALERVQDPGNVGSLLRTATAMGWDCIFLLAGCCDPFNEKVVRASRGGIFKVPIARGDVRELEAFARTRGLAMLAAEPEGVGTDAGATGSASGVGERTPPRGVCLLLGSEGQGVSEEALALCQRVQIPMAGDMESLNVSVAGGILMFALSRDGALADLAQQLGKAGAPAER